MSKRKLLKNAETKLIFSTTSIDPVENANRMSRKIDNGETVKIIDPGHDPERFQNLKKKFK